MNKTLSLLFGLGFIIIALSIGYYFVIFLPNRENQKLELEKAKLRQEELKNKAITDEKASQQIIREQCAANANKEAADLLKQKAELSGNWEMQEAAKKGLLLKDDYNTIYENCLSTAGLK